tara:strand:- start:7 stop:882 length:876 start_codon:yes stop_codon:yes gene_type:complete
MGVKILVIEDDLNMQDMVVELLEDEGYMVHGCSSVRDGLKAAESFDFDLLVTDVRMAEINGVEGFKLLKERQQELRCVVITGYATPEMAADAIQIDVDAIIKKPFRLELLLKSVEGIVKEHELRGHYLSLLLKFPVDALSAAVSFFKTDHKAKLEKERRACFQALLNAIRSEYLELRRARAVFSDLLECERMYKLHQSNPDTVEPGVVSRLYQRMQDTLQGFLRGKGSQPLSEGDVPRERFQVFFLAAKKNEVTLEQFLLAPSLLSIPDDQLLSQELLTLKRKLWGPDSKS